MRAMKTKAVLARWRQRLSYLLIIFAFFMLLSLVFALRPISPYLFPVQLVLGAAGVIEGLIGLDHPRRLDRFDVCYFVAIASAIFLYLLIFLR